MPSIDYEAARTMLNREFEHVEAELLLGNVQTIDRRLVRHFDIIFRSATQAYREVLIGCILARLQDKSIDVHKPYINQGNNAYNGRTLDERVVNPILQERRVPCSRGPFLSAFRRSVRFNRRTREGLRDKKGFDSLLVLVDHIASTDNDKTLIELLRYLIYKFNLLRSGAEILISHLSRISLEQYDTLITRLLSYQSGGRFPVFLVEAAFQAIKTVFNLSWVIECLGINVADSPSGAGGDITIRQDDRIIMAIEITERTVDRSRVVSTFNTKIAPQGIEDYLFFLKNPGIEDNVLQQTRQYFSQGHEVNFLEVKNWIVMILATLGRNGRTIFNQFLVNKLTARENPATVKLAWNNAIAELTST
jgi:hypothetical protein